jgi:hypothetical protein
MGCEDGEMKLWHLLAAYLFATLGVQFCIDYYYVKRIKGQISSKMSSFHIFYNLTFVSQATADANKQSRGYLVGSADLEMFE